MARLLRLTILATIFVALAVGLGGTQEADASSGYWWTTSHDQCLYLTDGSYSYAAICVGDYAYNVYFAANGGWFYQTSVTEEVAARFMLATTTSAATGYVGGTNGNLEVVSIQINSVDIPVNATTFDFVGFGFSQSLNNTHINNALQPTCYWDYTTCYYY